MGKIFEKGRLPTTFLNFTPNYQLIGFNIQNVLAFLTLMWGKIAQTLSHLTIILSREWNRVLDWTQLADIKLLKWLEPQSHWNSYQVCLKTWFVPESKNFMSAWPITRQMGKYQTRSLLISDITQVLEVQLARTLNQVLCLYYRKFVIKSQWRPHFCILNASFRPKSEK